MKVFGFRFTRRVNLFFYATDNEYWSRLTHAIELAHQINENIVISGDLNSNLFNVNNNKLNNNKLVDLMTTFNFRNVIVKPTRLNYLLDPIIISDTMTPLYSDVFKIPSEISEGGKVIL